MFRRLVLAGVVLAGVGAAVQPAAATTTSSQMAKNGTAMDVQFDRDEIHVGEGAGVQAHMHVDGVSAGTEVEIAAAGLSQGALAAMIDGDMTAHGVRTTVPANGTIPVHGPPSCIYGDFEFTVQRLDTGATATAMLTLTSLDVFGPQFERTNYSGTPGSVVPVTVETECSDPRVGIADPDSEYRASVAVEDDDRNHTVWIDTADPANASRLFTTEIDANGSDFRRSGVVPELNGTYRLFVGSSPNTPFTANLTISPDGTPRPSAGDGLSVEVYSDQFATNDRDGDEKFPFGISGVDSHVPVIAHLQNATADVPPATFAAMVSNDTAREDPRVRRFENGTVPLSIPAGMRCLGGDLTVAFQRLDTGATATAETTAVHYDAVGGSIGRRNYTVESGSVLPVTLSRECHEVTLELARTGSDATASVELGATPPVERNATVWFDTGRAGTANGLVRSEVGTPLRNATTDFSDGPLAPGTYSLRTVYSGHGVDTATLRVTNNSTGQPPADSTDDPPETPPSTPNTVVPPPTPEDDSTDAPTTDQPTTESTPSNRTAEGNAHRPAGTDPFGTTAAETDAAGPGFGPVLAALALAALAALGARSD